MNYEPREWQVKADLAMKRFNLVLVSRQSGKTVMSIAKLVDAAMRSTMPDPRYAYIDPYLKQARRVAWMYLKRMTENIPGIQQIESRGLVRFPHNGAEIELEGADTPDSLRGTYLDGAVLDEYEDMKLDVWESITLPKIFSRGGWAIIQGTLHGVGNLSQLYFKALSDPMWYVGNFTAVDTGYPGAEELEIARKNMTARRFAQEYMNDLSAGSSECGLSLREVAEANQRVLPPSAYSLEPIVMGVDVARGGDDMCAICFRQGLNYEPIVRFAWDGDVSTASRVGEYALHKRPTVINVDDTGGYGQMVVAKLRDLGFAVNPINFGSSPINPRYRNKRCEMWWNMWQHIKSGACLPYDQDLATDLTCVKYDHDNAKEILFLESKDDIRKRIGRSVDSGDAAALTHAVTVYRPTMGEGLERREIERASNKRYNPKLAAIKRSLDRH